MRDSPLTPCRAPGCTELALPCYRVALCPKHGEAANRHLSAQGLEFASWEERCAEVANWLRPKQTQGAHHVG